MDINDVDAGQGRRRTGRKMRGERGQALILFVAIFSVILAMGAVALDQGLAYGRHGQAQDIADAASRAGAYACLQALSDSGDVSDACDGAPEAAARANAVANLANASDVTPTPSDECNGTNDMPSMQVIVQRDSPALFLKAFGQDGFTAKAAATTCVGEISRIHEGAIPMIPAWFTLPSNSNGSDDPNKRACGDPDQDYIAGEVCVIFSTDINHNHDLESAGLFRRDSGNTTCGPANDAGILDGIEAGLATYNCNVGDPIQDESVNENDVLDAFQTRLDEQGPDYCPDSSNTQAAFAGKMQALGADAQDGPDFTFSNSDDRDADKDWTVYQGLACHAPRLALIPLVESSSDMKIVGFTAVYILGCYEDDDPRSATTTMNKCHNGDRARTDNCGGRNEPDCHDTEVRVGIVRAYIPRAAVQEIQGIVTTGSDGWVGKVASLGIQTTQ